MTERVRQLMDHAATWLTQGKCLDGSFLEEYDVSSGDCRALWDEMAAALIFYCAMPTYSKVKR